jgi:ABC-type Fe3+ transport system substrate-binding protein
MSPARVAVLVALLLVLGIPFGVRLQQRAVRAREQPNTVATGPQDTLIVVTPHVEQIRAEFGERFDRWRRHRSGRPARIDWRSVGGTSEIIKLLEAQYAAAFKAGLIAFTQPGRPSAAPGSLGFDVMFGGGSYEHGKLKAGVTVDAPAPPGVPGGPGQDRRVRIPMSVPAGFTREQLDAWYGPNQIGAQHLYDPDQHWLGTALSGFGIVFNRDRLREQGLPEPRAFADLTDPGYAGGLALADPRLSGSVTTTYESILNKEGWERGWRILRDLAANARYFASSSTRPPVDVAAGDAIAGLAIDFYGRGQAQAIMQPGETADTCRVGYVDPQGAVYIDADPVSILLGGPNPALAREFVEFCLSDEAQSLWQMPARVNPASANNPAGEDGERLGPRRYELRRMPVRRSMYERYGAHFIDRANPFDLASPVKPRGWRDAIAPMMAAFAIDCEAEVRAAWRALNSARAAAAADPSMVPLLERMEAMFYAMPDHPMPAGAPAAGGAASLPFTEANYRAIADATDRWRDPVRGAEARIAYTRFFREQYRRVVEAWRNRPAGPAGPDAATAAHHGGDGSAIPTEHRLRG